MNVVKWFVAIWMVSVTILLAVVEKIQPDTHAKIFCAYNRIFVEFEEGHSKWGTIMLDSSGRPIPCSDDDIEELPVNTKEII